VQPRTTLLSAQGISKSFGGIAALQDVSFDIGQAEVVGLVGDNGAGKSTFISILMGVIPPDTGSIFFDGQEARFSSPREARESGIEPVYQQSALVDLMNLWRNFFLGREIVRRVGPFHILDKRAMRQASMKIVKEVGVGLRAADAGVSNLSGGERQAICIGRSMHFDAKLLLLDEPTAALSVRETQRVLRFAEESRERGVSVLIVDHNIHHIYPIVDKFVILERGKKIAEMRPDEASAEDVIKAITQGHSQKTAGTDQ
jgi:simple sugar transport system ATP-binding protein